MRTNHVGWNPACSLLTSAEGDTFFPECSNTVEVHKRMRTNHVGWNPACSLLWRRGRTRPNFQMENRPAVDGSQATATETGRARWRLSARVSVQRRTLAGAAALPPCRTDRSPSRQLRANSDGIATLRYSLRRRHDSYDTGPKASLKNRRRE